jgi:hypothetical protein
LTTTNIDDLTVEDLRAFCQARRNTCESNHPFEGNKSFMNLLVEGSGMLVQEFGETNGYQLISGGSDEAEWM